MCTLRLLRLDPEDPAAIQQLLGFRAGRCYLRDFEGQVAPVQIEPPNWLLERLDTTPREEDAPAKGCASIKDSGNAFRPGDH